MLVQIGNRLDINLSRILYCEHDFDTDVLNVIFDNGVILRIKDATEINELEYCFRYSDSQSPVNNLK